MRMNTSKPAFSAYEFMRALCAACVLEQKMVVDFSLVTRQLYHFKREHGEEVQYLFEDIEFKDNGDTITSKDVENSILELQMFGLISRMNAMDSRYIISLSTTEAQQILQTYVTKVYKHFIAAAKAV